MNRPEIQRCVVFNDNVYIKGDIVRIYTYDCIGNEISYAGRIYKIDDFYVYVDISRPYNSDTRSFEMSRIDNIERITENGD